MIHSGSRRLGLEVAAYYQKEAFHQCPEGTPYELAYAAGELMENYLRTGHPVPRHDRNNGGYYPHRQYGGDQPQKPYWTRYIPGRENA